MPDLSERERAILAALPATSADLVELTGVSQPTVWRALQRLKALRLCFVWKWEKGAALYGPGFRTDAARPGRRTKEINAKAYRKRKARAAGPFAQLFI